MDINMIFNKIDILISSKKLSKMSFYAAIGYTQPGYEKMRTNKSLKIETLFIISETLGVESGYFFEVESKNYSDLQLKYYDLLEKYNNCLEQKEMLLPKKFELNEPEEPNFNSNQNLINKIRKSATIKKQI